MVVNRSAVVCIYAGHLHVHMCTRGKSCDIAERGALLAKCTNPGRTIDEMPPVSK